MFNLHTFSLFHIFRILPVLTNICHLSYYPPPPPIHIHICPTRCYTTLQPCFISICPISQLDLSVCASIPSDPFNLGNIMPFILFTCSPDESGEHSAFYSRSYADPGASQGPHSFNSRSYVEDVTSVTSGASQGPHSFNLVFVCLFVSRLALSHICPVPYHQTQLATYSWPQYSNRAFKRKIIT